MAFMSAKKTEPTEHRNVTASRPAATAQRSVLGPDMEVSGNVRSKGEIEVNGKIDGDIACQILTVGKSAAITGKVTAESVHVRGRLEGEIKATSVTLQSTAHVVGEILHKSLSIEAGAYIEGNAKRIDGEASANGKVTPLKLSLSAGSPAAGPAAEQVAKAAK